MLGFILSAAIFLHFETTAYLVVLPHGTEKEQVCVSCDTWNMTFFNTFHALGLLFYFTLLFTAVVRVFHHDAEDTHALCL